MHGQPGASRRQRRREPRGGTSLLRVQEQRDRGHGGRSSEGAGWATLLRVTQPRRNANPNLDPATVEHFGQEWSRFTQQKTGWGDHQLSSAFEEYFAPLPRDVLHRHALVGDLGAGSGRWAAFVAPMVARLYVVEPSRAAMAVARNTLADHPNIVYVDEPIGGPSLRNESLDVAYSLGVIHHIPDPVRALKDVRATLKPGGLFLGYLYYALDNRPRWYRALWRFTDRLRFTVSGLPERYKRIMTDIAATFVYWPLARAARLLETVGLRTSMIPLNQYAHKTYYVMRNDALDRFGTPLEQRFTRAQIAEMLHDAGFDVSTLVFSDHEPFWCFSVANPG